MPISPLDPKLYDPFISAPSDTPMRFPDLAGLADRSFDSPTLQLPDANGWFSVEHPPKAEYDATGNEIEREYLVYIPSLTIRQRFAYLRHAADSVVWIESDSNLRLLNLSHYRPKEPDPIAAKAEAA